MVATKPLDAKWDMRDGFHVWFFPGHAAGRRIAWAYVAGSRRRTALVCRVAMGDRVLHLVEIERRPAAEGGSTEGFNMLSLVALEPSLEPAVSRLLDITARGRGVWPNAVAWTTAWTGSSEDMVRIAKRRHEYVAPSIDVEGAGAPRRLDHRFLSRWITSFLANEAAPARAGTGAEMNP